MTTDKEREYQRNYAQTEKRKAAVRKYNQSEGGKVKNKVSMLRWRKENREKYLASLKKSDLKRHYGLTPEQFQVMWEAQGRRCGACGSEHCGRKNGQWSIDHDHDKKTVRMILCNGCNLILGHAKDRVERLHQMVAYLEKFDVSLETRQVWGATAGVGLSASAGRSSGLLY